MAQPAGVLNAYHCGLLHPSGSQLPDKVSYSIHFWALMLLRTNELLIMGVPQPVRGFLLSSLHGLDAGNKQTRQTKETYKDHERAYFNIDSHTALLQYLQACLFAFGKWANEQRDDVLYRHSQLLLCCAQRSCATIQVSAHKMDATANSGALKNAVKNLHMTLSAWNSLFSLPLLPYLTSLARNTKNTQSL